MAAMTQDELVAMFRQHLRTAMEAHRIAGNAHRAAVDASRKSMKAAREAAENDGPEREDLQELECLALEAATTASQNAAGASSGASSGILRRWAHTLAETVSEFTDEPYGPDAIEAHQAAAWLHDQIAAQYEDIGNLEEDA